MRKSACIHLRAQPESTNEENRATHSLTSFLIPLRITPENALSIRKIMAVNLRSDNWTLANIRVLILGETHKPTIDRSFRIDYGLIL